MEKSPLLEINMAGPAIELIDNCQIAITGADISPTLDGVPVNMDETISVKKTSILKFGQLVNGCRAYLAIRGEWKINHWMNPESPINLSTISSLNNIQIVAPSDFISKQVCQKKTF